MRTAPNVHVATDGFLSMTMFRSQDLDTQCVPRLCYHIKVQLIQVPAAPYKAGTVYSAKEVNRVSQSIWTDTGFGWKSIAQVPVDGAGGSAMG